jgi:uncharacterized protein (DUF427 family)
VSDYPAVMTALNHVEPVPRFDWAAMDAWFEEDEQVFVHPRTPYVRVDALRSNRPVRVELGYWSVRAGGAVHKDLVWAYDFPTRQLLPIAGMIAFYNEKVDTILDGQLLERPKTHFFPSEPQP